MLKAGDTCEVDGVIYRVVSVESKPQEDGTTVTVTNMEKVSE